IRSFKIVNLTSPLLPPLSSRYRTPCSLPYRIPELLCTPIRPVTSSDSRTCRSARAAGARGPRTGDAESHASRLRSWTGQRRRGPRSSAPGAPWPPCSPRSAT
ncbi:hypothetical protein PENTCL1PPCAC_24123, partial [Pristionchus entomophagus]